MAVRLDKVLMSSLHESFKNYQTTVSPIVVSGSIPTIGKTFFVEIPYTRAGSIADIYVHKQGTNYKRSVNYAWRLDEFVGVPFDVDAGIYVLYSPGIIRVEIFVSNSTGAPYGVTTQTFDIEAVIFDAPLPS